ncbi:methyltransferase domain-containing protein [Candidatus Thiothrix sp. Deng01]|uniref:Methyltransferase domain-containing protein n=1 Tax=Candidatus Thiothrix phosphatis TaxID=3112415 RepID=A0ABU6D226_9GAMM|nr:methyltransferase domain-containing protein [Candidatus Thiothrix sp. Deng01]MEB4593126.1 methyltransferase domain-containing protein [Candidatus Thiothrix sp. Deng01]
MPDYANDIYHHQKRHTKTLHSANIILSILLKRLPEIRSAVDLGCGVGTWLSVLQEKGASRIQGADGDWVNPEFLVIPEASFKQIDFGVKPIKVPGHYDLAISLEVAEHLPPDNAQAFVQVLTELADFVLFSAAIPFQGGVGHVNEQWPEYWIDLFSELDYEVHDFIRPVIWNNKQIPVWYRQNILFFSHSRRSAEVDSLGGLKLPVNIVHPTLYLERLKKAGNQKS